MTTIGIVLSAVEASAIVATLFYVMHEFRLQREELDGQRRALNFQVYQQISERYTDHLWKATDDPELNCIWERLDDERRAELETAQAGSTWGAWATMDLGERKSYRYTRAAFEVFEQAHHVYRLGWLSDETWSKWRGWVAIWIDTRYFPYVWADSCPRFLPSFVDFVETVIDERGDRKPGSGLVPATAEAASG